MLDRAVALAAQQQALMVPLAQSVVAAAVVAQRSRPQMDQAALARPRTVRPIRRRGHHLRMVLAQAAPAVASILLMLARSVARAVLTAVEAVADQLLQAARQLTVQMALVASA
jgi:hypothetical protein